MKNEKEQMEKELLNEMEKHSPLVITKDAAPDKKTCAMYAFALLRHPDVLDGDVEIIYSDEDDIISIIEAANMTFEEFWKRISGYSGFHCRVKLPCTVSPYGVKDREIAIISRNYNYMFDFMMQKEPLMIQGGILWEHDEIDHLFKDILCPYVTKIKKNEPLPTKSFTNPAPDMLHCEAKLIKEKQDADGKIHVAERTEMDEQVSYCCFRPDFNFFCVKEIACCGQCPIMYKAYDLLINEALDKESADRLKKLVEESEIFALDCEDGTRKCKYAGQCQDVCKSKAALLAREEIRRYWFECYRIL